MVDAHRQVDVLADANWAQVVTERRSEHPHADRYRHVQRRLLRLHIIVDVRNAERGNRRLTYSDAQQTHS